MNRFALVLLVLAPMLCACETTELEELRLALHERQSDVAARRVLADGLMTAHHKREGIARQVDLLEKELKLEPIALRPSAEPLTATPRAPLPARSLFSGEESGRLRAAILLADRDISDLDRIVAEVRSLQSQNQQLDVRLHDLLELRAKGRLDTP